jgi:UDPglucose 6-dehydrogenase
VTFADSSYGALEGADALALITEWNEFREPDYGRMKSLMRTPVVFDGRNIYKADTVRSQGFTYFSMGRP